MKRKARIEGATADPKVIEAAIASVKADPVPGDNGEALARITDYFKATHPDEWEALRLCPLQHGLADMIDKLKG